MGLGVVPQRICRKARVGQKKSQHSQPCVEGGSARAKLWPSVRPSVASFLRAETENLLGWIESVLGYSARGVGVGRTGEEQCMEQQSKRKRPMD